MRSRSSLVLAAALAVLLQSASVDAQETKGAGIPRDEETSDEALGVFLRAAVYSDYVFRGYNLYDGMSFQPNMGVWYDFGSAGRLNASLWMHVPIESGERTTIDVTPFSDATNFPTIDFTEFDAPQVKFIELDPTLSYDTVLFDKLSVSVGHTWYTDPKSGKQNIFVSDFDPTGQDPNIGAPTLFERVVSRGDTSEFFLSLGLDTILNPEFTFVVDYREYEYEYYVLGFSESFKMGDGKGLSIKPFVQFAFSTGNDEANLDDAGSRQSGIYKDNGLVHVNMGISATAQFGAARITPMLMYVLTEDDFISTDDIVWAGFALDYDTTL